MICLMFLMYILCRCIITVVLKAGFNCRSIGRKMWLWKSWCWREQWTIVAAKGTRVVQLPAVMSLATCCRPAGAQDLAVLSLPATPPFFPPCNSTGKQHLQARSMTATILWNRSWWSWCEPTCFPCSLGQQRCLCVHVPGIDCFFPPLMIR